MWQALFAEPPGHNSEHNPGHNLGHSPRLQLRAKLWGTVQAAIKGTILCLWEKGTGLGGRWKETLRSHGSSSIYKDGCSSQLSAQLCQLETAMPQLAVATLQLAGKGQAQI